jgi:hypothetical protein
MSISTPNKGGRPRKHSSNAARIAAWRAKRKTEVSLQAPLGEKAVLTPPETASKADWNKYLNSIGLAEDVGLYMPEASSRRGKLHSGGHGNQRLQELDQAHEARKAGKRSKSFGPDSDFE